MQKWLKIKGKWKTDDKSKTKNIHRRKEQKIVGKQFEIKIQDLSKSRNYVWT